MNTTTMKQVVLAGHEVANAYAKLVTAADALADLMEFNSDYVLRRVMPLKATERRNHKQILDFLETEYDSIKKHLEKVAKVRAEAAARAELLAKLNLSAADKKLLGIASDTYE